MKRQLGMCMLRRFIVLIILICAIYSSKSQEVQKYLSLEGKWFWFGYSEYIDEFDIEKLAGGSYRILIKSGFGKTKKNNDPGLLLIGTGSDTRILYEQKLQDGIRYVSMELSKDGKKMYWSKRDVTATGEERRTQVYSRE